MPILRAVDKLAKIGPEDVKKLLLEQTGPDEADKILAFIRAGGDFLSVLDQLEALSGGESDDSRRLREIHLLASDLGIAGRLVLDPSITRGSIITQVLFTRPFWTPFQPWAPSCLEAATIILPRSTLSRNCPVWGLPSAWTGFWRASRSSVFSKVRRDRAMSWCWQLRARLRLRDSLRNSAPRASTPKCTLRKKRHPSSSTATPR